MSKVLDELHKIREKHYEETKHLSPKELASHINKEGKEAAKKFGQKIKSPESVTSK